MGRIAQAFELAERYVGAHERYVDETVKRYRELSVTEERATAASERSSAAVEGRLADRELGNHIADLNERLTALATQLAGLNWGGMVDVLRDAVSAQTGGKADSNG